MGQNIEVGTMIETPAAVFIEMCIRDRAEQHQRRAMQCPADGTGHGGAAHGGGVAAQIHQHVQTGLLGRLGP